MRRTSQARATGYVILALVVTATLAGQAQAESLTFAVNLQTGVGDTAIPPYISYQSPIQDANGDGWYETVLKITLNGSPYNQAMFQVQYAASPTGMTVNIGDSSTNNGFSGDAATQSNDAEMNIGGPSPNPPRDLFVFGNDNTPGSNHTLAQVPDFAANGVLASLTVRNDFFAWDNHQGKAGDVFSPYLYALNGQPDTEGPVNYDIYASFNRDIAGSGRYGTGAGQVIITLSTSPNPIPSSSWASDWPALAWRYVGGRDRAVVDSSAAAPKRHWCPECENSIISRSCLGRSSPCFSAFSLCRVIKRTSDSDH